MKKIMLSLLCAGIVSSASAQKGSVLVLGNIGGSTHTVDLPAAGSTTTTNFYFSPAVGYQFTDKWTLGVQGIFDYNTLPGAAGATTNVTNAGGGVFARYTMPLAGVFSWFLQGGVNYTSITSSTSGFSSSSSAIGVNVMPAVMMNLKNGFAINFGFGNLGFSYEDLGASASATSIDYSFFNTAHFGMSKNFGKKVKPTKKHSDVEANEAE